MTIVGGLSALLIGAALAGCSGQGGNDSGPVTLTVQQQANWGPMMQVLIKDWEKKNPNVKIKLETITDSQKNSTNTQVITGNNPPDVAFVPANSPVYQQSLQAKALAPIDDVWANQKLQQRYGSSNAATLVAPDGKHYLATIDSIYYDIVYYNKDLFKSAGIADPTDHRFASNNELFDAVNKLHSKGLQPLSFDGTPTDGRFGWMVDQLLQSLSSASQIQNYLTNFNPKVKVTANYDSGPFASAVKQIKTWSDHQVFAAGYLSQQDTTSEALFTQQKAAMYLGGNWSASDFTKAHMNYGWALLPSGNASKSAIPSYHGESIAVTAKSKHLVDAKKFVEFWLSDAEQEAAVTKLALPAVNTVDVSKVAGIDPTVREQIADVNKNGAPVGWTSAVPGAFGQQNVLTLINQMLSGEITVDQVLQQQQAALRKIRGQ